MTRKRLLVPALTVGLVGALLSVSAGSATNRAQPPPKAKPSGPAAPPLPEWAPKHPSPEFLRAARVLKPIPAELDSADESSPGSRAAWARHQTTWVPAYELFGTLTDDQTRRFLAEKKLRLPVKTLSKRQREILDRWLETWRKAHSGVNREEGTPEDYLVALYKAGAARDLSDVEVGFATIPIGTTPGHVTSTHRVHLWFWVTRPGGGIEQLGSQFAQI